jgi:glyoxylase-like metal-dependent hydrolase (beta-lactamase superfamily II)
LQIHRGEKQMLDYAPISGKAWGLPFENYTGELIFLDEEDKISVGDESLDILFTPGHSPASISFYHSPSKSLLAGDVLFRAGIGRTDLPGGDYDTLITSIREKLFVLPDNITVYPGHGPTTTIGYEKSNNPFLV